MEIANHIYLIDNFLTSLECDQLIARSEQIGYEESTVMTEKGQRRIEDLRNNYRVLFTDSVLATELWQKMSERVPGKIGNSVAVGLNELFRFYRYEPGQLFKKHIDESFIRDENEASYYTFMIYLNDAYRGGETKFSETIIKGKKGMALIFLHSLLHEGSEVTMGVKYVLRTDIMYRLKTE